MIRFLLMFLLLLPGAEFVASNIDEVESFTTTAVGAQFSMAVSPKTTLRKPLPTSHGLTSKGAMTNPPQSKESKSQPGLLKDSPEKPVRIQPVQRDPELSEANATHHQQRTPTPHGTKVAMTAKSHLLDESTLERPVSRKGPTPHNKSRTVVKPNPSSRYQSLPHFHHKNITSNPETGQLKDSNVTTGPKPQRTVMVPLRNAFKPGQKGNPFPPDKVKHFPVGLQRAMQMGMQLKENTSQLLNTLINHNSSFTNSIQHMARSSNSTFTTVKEAVPRQLNSLHSQDQHRNFENATSVPNVDQHNDVSRSGIFGRVHVPVEHDSRVMQELRSKVKVRITDGNLIYNHTNLNLRDAIFSTEPAGLVQEETGHHQPESTTQVSVSRTTQLNTSATWTERTLTKVTNLNNYPHGRIDAETEGYTQLMTGVGPHLHKEKKQARLAIAESQQSARNQTHSHKHRHTVLDQLKRETNTISQHNATLFDRTAGSQPHRHHPKHLHNSTHPHSHSHHKHRSDHHHPQRNHISETPIHQNIQEKPDVATHMQLSQSSAPQFYVDSVKPIQLKPSTKNSTHSHPMLLRPYSRLEALQENQPYTQSVLRSHSELTTQAHEHTTLYRVSVTDSSTTIQKLSNMEQGAQSEAYQNPHTEPSIHEHLTSHTKFSLTQTTGHNMTTNFKQVLTTQPQLALTTLVNPEKKTQGQSEIHPTHEELTTPMQKQQTVKNQLDLAFWSLPKLTTPTKPGLSFQTQPEIITQTLSDLGKVIEVSTQTQPEWSEQGFFARERSVWSTHRLPDSTKNPLSPVTATTPFLVTQSQSEPTTERPTDFVKPAYVNATQTEAFTDGFNKNRPNTEPVTATYTVQTTNSPMDLSRQRGLQAKGTMDSTNQTEEMRNSEIKYPAQEEPILKLQSDSSTQTESRTESFTQSKTTAASKINVSTTSKEPVTEERDTSNRTPLTTKSIESTTSTELVTEEGDTSNRTPSTIKSHTESSQIESTTRYSTHITTNTEQATRQDSVSNTQKKTAVPYSSDAVTQTSTTIHGADKIGPTSQTELIFKTSLKPPTHYHLETITHKELIQSIQPDNGTPTYSQESMWTMPELIKNADKDRATEMYGSTEKTSMPVNTRATGGSRTTWTVGYNSYSQNGSDNSRAIPAWGGQTFHPTSALPSGVHNSGDPATTVKIYRTKAPSSTKSVTSPPSSTSTLQTLGELMSVQPGRDRIFIVEEQQPLFKVTTISVTHRVDVTRSVTCDQPDKCRNHFIEEVTSAYMAAPGFDRTDILNVTLAGGALEYKVLFGVRIGSPLTSEQELLLTDPTSLFQSLAPAGGTPLLSAVRNASLTDAPADPCADWFSCPRGFHCVPQRQLSALCLSPCHSAFCQNDGICIHRRGQDPVCQCPVGTDFWYMGPTCDYRMTHHRLAAIACAAVFCIIICAAATVFILVRRFQTQILQQKVAQTQSSYRRFSRFDDVPTHFWCPSQTWLTTSASLNSLDNPAFSSSEEVFPLQALGSCVCGCQNPTRSNPPTNPPEPPSRAPPRLETSGSSVNELMIDSGKASDVSVCSWPMEPIHWTPFPILHQLSLQSPFHARRPHSYFEGMELVNTERSWTA